MKNPAKFTSLAVLCMAVLTACGGGGDDATPVAAAPTPPPVSISPAPGIGPAPVTPAPPAAVVTPPPPPPVVVTPPPPPPVVVTPPPPPPVVVTPPPPPPVVVTPPPPPPVVVTPPPPPPVVVTPPPPPVVVAPPPPPVVVAPPPPPPGEPAVGNPAGTASVPTAGQAANTSTPTTVVGTGTAASCTGAAVVAAVAQGGVITFNCGAAPVNISMTSTAKVFNDKPDVTLDGGGKVTLDGGGNTRILYQNTCDSAQVFLTSACQNQERPRLTVQNITMRNGNSTGQTAEGGGGGAIFVRGGQFKIVNSRFFNNQCEPTGQDKGGGAVRVLSIYNDLPVYVVNSTFGGAAGFGNKCSNGGALSSIGVSYSVLNSLFTHNEAIGNGANPAQAGTPGGGSGGAIYNDGNAFSLVLSGSIFRDNTANEGGGAVFFVSNNNTGSLSIVNSAFNRNVSRKFDSPPFTGFYIKGANQFMNTGSTFTAN